MQGFRIYRKNTDQNTAKTPIELPQKHRTKCRKNTDLILHIEFYLLLLWLDNRKIRLWII
jgi:ADP-dependent phosphofructokinase/glucokinase